MPASYEGHAESGDKGVVFAVHGEVDLHSAPTLKRDLLEAAASTDGDLVIDLSGLAFIDSRGLAVLVGVRGRLLEQDRAVWLIVPAPRVMKAFTVTGLDRVFSFVRTPQEAWAPADRP